MLGEIFDARVGFVLRHLDEFLRRDARLLELPHLLLVLGDQCLLPLRYPGTELGDRRGCIAEVSLGGLETSVADFDLRGGIRQLRLEVVNSSPHGGELFCVFLVVEAPLRREEGGGVRVANHRCGTRRLLDRLFLEPACAILHRRILWSGGRG